MSLRCILFLSIYSLLSIFSFGQSPACFDNPSLEGPPARGKTPPMWDICFGTSDTQPGWWGVTMPASKDTTYVGLIHRGSVNEGITQNLSTPLVAGRAYVFRLDLAHSLIYNTAPPMGCYGSLALFGGMDSCSTGDTLWKSDTIFHTNWQTYTIQFVPDSNYTYVTFSPYTIYSCAPGYINILIDNLTCFEPFKVDSINATCYGICDGTAFVSFNGVSPYSYIWSTGDTTDTIKNLCAGTYWLTYMDSLGVVATDTFTINEPDSVASNMNIIDVTCNGGSDGKVFLNTSGGVSPYSYLWTLSGDTTDSITGLIPGVYPLITTDSTNCIQNDTAVVTQPPPMVLTNSVDSLCLYDLVTLSTTGAQFNWWANSNKPTDTLFNGNPYIFAPDSTSIFIVTGWDTNGCLYKDSVLITVMPHPLIGYALTPDTICYKNTSIFTATGAASYWWAQLTSPNDTIGTGTPITISDSVTKDFILTGLSTFGCISKDTFELFVRNAYTIDSIYGTPYVCPLDDSIDYWVQGNPGSIYDWSVVRGNIISGQGTDSIKVDWDTTGSAMVQVVETNKFGCSSDSALYPVNINFLFTPIAPLGPDTICYLARDSISYSAIYTNGANYYWDMSGGKILNGDSTHIVLVNWDTVGTFYIVYNEENITIDTICFNPSDTTWVTILPSPNQKIIVGDMIVCEFDSNIVYSVAQTGGSIYLWTVTGGVLNSGDSTNSIIVDWDTNGTYTISVVEINSWGCTGDTISTVITINTKPTPIGIFGNDTICGPDSTGLIYTVNGYSNSTFEWIISGGTITNGQGMDSITVNWNLYEGSGQIQVVEISVDSCRSDTLTLDLLFDNPLIDILVVTDGVTDQEDITIEWTLNNGDNFNGKYYLYRKVNHPDSSWSFIDTVQRNKYLDENRPTNQRSFEYFITGVNVCRDTVSADKHHSILLAGTNDEPSKSVVLKWNHYINWPQGVDEYEVWRKTNLDINYSYFESAHLDTVVTIEYNSDVTEHCYRIKASQLAGSNNSWSNEICFELLSGITIPTAISPNGDGVNDTWIIKRIATYPLNRVEIYNRWGNIVYVKDGYLNEWNGTNKGKLLPTGTYYYILKLNAGLSGVEDTYKGHVTIFR